MTAVASPDSMDKKPLSYAKSTGPSLHRLPQKILVANLNSAASTSRKFLMAWVFPNQAQVRAAFKQIKGWRRERPNFRRDVSPTENQAFPDLGIRPHH